MEIKKIKNGVVSLSYPMLTRDNYTAWSMRMKVFMQANSVWTAVELKYEKEKVEDKEDKISLDAIFQSIPEDVLLFNADKETTNEAWDAVKTLSQGAGRVKKVIVQTLKAEFESLSMKETDKLDDFYTNLKGLVTNKRDLGEEVKESYVVKKLLCAVSLKFLQITSTIEQFGNLEKMSMEEEIGSLRPMNNG
ncbi:uncharacterized protein LOC141717570 [Apium graveolens]|uniref:uncharacterized protein LOC141717570 n=1 Tax=Apium graveolens TaxID=4045 RepID=UPI003D7A86CC